MLNKEEELGCLEILKNNFPDLKQRGLVIGLSEFLSPDVNLKNFICVDKTAKEAAVEYMTTKTPYIVLDESEGYKCIFFRGNFIKAQFDATNFKMLRYFEETDKADKLEKEALNYKLLYFNGCPNHQRAVDLLNECSLEFVAICQDKLSETDPLKNYSSPTLLCGDKIIFGAPAAGGGCSMLLPSKDELLKIL